MQDQTKLTVNGQEVQIADLNAISKAASSADDVVFSELLRVAPYDGTTIARLILPHDSTGTVTNGGGTLVGAVNVNPFRAIVGARAITLDASNRFKDIRSALFVNSTGTNTNATITIAAQTAGAGTKRIDLVYATIYVDQDGALATRYQKDPTTHNVVPVTLAPTIHSYVTVSSVTGVAGATPAIPALPSDPVGGYNIPLAYIRVDNGFGASSVVPSNYILEVMPVPSQGPRPASELSNVGSPFFDGRSKTKFFMPPSMGTGSVERWFSIDTATITSGTVIDGSIDWRKRVVRGDCQIAAGGTDMAWNSTVAGSLPYTSTPTRFLTNTFDDNATDFVLVTFSGGLLAAGTSISLVVDFGTGELYLRVVGSPTVACFFWLDASGQFANPL